ncbi:MAG: translocation/assembly module TamB domain-containing protein, partial [bacterium]
DSESPNNFRLKLSDLDISRYYKFLAQEVPLDGRFNLDLQFTGTLANPIFDGTFELVNGQYSQVPFARFAGNFAVQEKALVWQCVLSQVENDSLLQSSGHLPLKLSLVPYEYKLFPDEQLECKVNARGLDLSFLQAFTKSVQNIKGTLVADVVLRNTLNDLRGVGPIRLFDGEFDISELGTKYRNVNLALILKDKDLLIRDFRMRSGGGELKLVEGGLSLTKKSLKDFKARFKVANFQLMNNKKMQAKVKGEIELTGSVQAPYFTGDLTVNESRVYYPAWIEEETTVELTSRPFFIIAPDASELDTTGALRFQKSFSGTETDFTETQFFKNLRGELSVYFPRNTWIRSEDTNIEVEGDLAVVKEGPGLALFGSFSAIRGYYELLGNRFQIKRGELVFNGELEPNPEVDIEADYEFKDVSGDDPQKHKFVVLITGKLYAPEFKFTLDGKVAAQEDILSVLVFGQSYADLSFGQKNSVSNDSGLEKKATGFLTGQVLKRLSGRLGKELHLDVIQIESGKNLEDARLRVGKYVTPDVFVSISQDFGAEGNQKVELEYEIPKKILFFNLLLQASKERQGNTGLDVIWKIEW